MNIAQVVDDSMIWKNKKSVSPELQELFRNIDSFTAGTTYEVQLSKAYKSLKTYISKQFTGKKVINVKPKDDSLMNWYIRVDTRAPKARKINKTSKKQPNKGIKQTVQIPAQTAQAAGNGQSTGTN